MSESQVVEQLAYAADWLAKEIIALRAEKQKLLDANQNLSARLHDTCETAKADSARWRERFEEQGKQLDQNVQRAAKLFDENTELRVELAILKRDKPEFIPTGNQRGDFWKQGAHYAAYHFLNRDVIESELHQPIFAKLYEGNPYK